MIFNHAVIALCESTNYKEQILEANNRLSLAGNIVISITLFGQVTRSEISNDIR